MGEKRTEQEEELSQNNNVIGGKMDGKRKKKMLMLMEGTKRKNRKLKTGIDRLDYNENEWLQLYNLLQKIVSRYIKSKQKKEISVKKRW